MRFNYIILIFYFLFCIQNVWCIFGTLDNIVVFLVEIFYQSVYKSMDFVNYTFA
jgi:hypothetical protein